MTVATVAPRPPWDAETTVLRPVHARPVAAPPVRPKPLLIMPLAGTDVGLQSRLLDAVASWYEREFQRPMPNTHVAYEETPLGPAMVVYSRPVA
jgi:hypothetical protein